jgi:hypothetical protein
MPTYDSQPNSPMVVENELQSDAFKENTIPNSNQKRKRKQDKESSSSITLPKQSSRIAAKRIRL